jgi:transcriptional repressor NrdR
MKCPFCAAEGTRVIDTREVSDGMRRRRECGHCRQRFTTYERLAAMNIMVVKRDGRREEFDREKVLKGMSLACTKRPVSTNDLEAIAGDIETRLYSMGKSEINSQTIGEMVMDALHSLDDVAYVRYASIYRSFQDVDTMAKEIEHLRERRKREEELKNQMPLPLKKE